MKQLINDSKLNEMLKKHDKYYSYSDDMRAYSKGSDERQAIINYMLTALNMTQSEAIELYTNYINGNN